MRQQTHHKRSATNPGVGAGALGVQGGRDRDTSTVYASLRGCWDRFSARISKALDNSDQSNNQNSHGHDYRSLQGRGRSSSRHTHSHNNTNYHNPSSSSNQTILPDGFQKRKTAQGQVYFLHPSGERTWYDPRVPDELVMSKLNLDSLVGKLSPSWEVRVTPHGRCYFVNHSKKTTQFTDPRLITYKEFLMTILNKRPVVNNNVMLPASTNNATSHQQQNSSSYDPQGSNVPKRGKELFDKIAILRQELQSMQIPSGPCRIDISRKNIFEQSYRSVMKLRPRDLRKRLMIKFRGEEGLDYGGVAREWLYLLSREMLNPNYGLFQYTRDDIYKLQINPDSGIAHPEHLSYLQFCGRIMGLAVFHGHHIEGCFTLPFYKMLLNKQITLDDIEHVDPELHRSLCWMLSNDITEVIYATFSVEHNAYGQMQVHELKPGGKDTPVTEENKQEYVCLYVNFRYRMGIEQQFKALQRGFYELIPSHLVLPFDERELELLIGGLSKIDVDDWKQNTRLKHCNIDTPLVKWFWRVVKSYSEDKRARLLQFVTGSSRVPIQGFKALQGVNAGPRLFTIHLVQGACTDNLPKAHTCFNRIDIPLYESYEKLYDKLTQAIEETVGFAVE